jgi:hypothetical protein
MENLFYPVYLSSLVLGVVVGAFAVGFAKARDSRVDSIDILMPIYMITLFWPFILLVSPAIGLIYIIYRLGKFFGNR